jgi:hypothetical protein
MKNRICKIISVVSVAPLIALYVLTAIYLHDKSIFGGTLWYVISIVFLTILPISAYILEHVLPAYKGQGRKGERRLAFVMCIVGYVLGTVVSLIFKAPQGVKLLFISYLVSGGLLALINSVIKYKASGHACGVAGPCVALIYFLGIKTWYVILLLIPVFWARISMGRHTFKELISGAAVGMAGTALTILIFMHL